MLKHLIVAALAVSSLAVAAPPVHGAMPLQQSRPGRQFDDGRADARRVTQLLREFDSASAQRDRRALSSNERQFSLYVQDELHEVRGQGNQRRLTSISSDLARLQGRMDRRSLRAKRELYVELMELAHRGARRF
jgi:hypothetical protein